AAQKLCRVLLVGEGNFSFSASVCETAGSCTEITATCFQPEEAARQQVEAGRNIQRLLERGAEVYFQVDCTQLKECVALSGRQFDRVVFNFPHCGRKAGVRKNRTLLTKFFLSCAEVLSEDGEVHIALCNGQGGTPADQPMREWHNSWQVVAMAAEAGFILSEICPFDCAKYHSYRSTGYRKIPVSRDNLPAFHETLLICGFDPERRPDYIRVLQRSLEKVIPAKLDSSERLLTFQKLSDAPVLHGISVKQKGERQVGWIAVIPPGRFHPDLHVCAVTLNLDLLAMLVFGVQDWRMLWSSDPRFLDQFGQTELRPLQSFSLHPPLYQHDVSFWVDPLSFDELGFHSLVRQVTAGAVIDVRLVDSFQYPHMPQASRCYRLSYQACDRALSSRKAHELQLRLREQIQQRLQVTLR
ncbi:UNVERIFIED_CONTAM: hypothetical protein FKN15_041161, partial [Acipenser sinensis]